MSLMACVIISRLTNYAVKGLGASLYARSLSTSVPLCAAAPNVVIYASDNEEKYFKISALLGRIFSQDSLAVYPLTRESLLKHDAAWLKNVRGLVLDDCERLSREEATRLLSFFKQGGKILDLGSNLCKHIGIGRGDTVLDQENERPIVKLSTGDILVRAKGLFSSDALKAKSEDLTLRPVLNDNQGKTVALEVAHNASKGLALLSRVPFHLSATDVQLSDENRKLFEKQTPNRDGVVLDLFKRLEFVSADYVKPVQEKNVAEPSAQIFVFGKPADRVVSALKSVEKYKGLKSEVESLKTFSSEDYFSTLKTRQLGNAVIYQPICETTMDLVKMARNHIDAKDVSLVGVADRQTSGIGRAGNKWLSPPGGATFTFSFAVDANSGLGKRLPLIQSIAALGCVSAIKELSSRGDKSIDVRIKWPNDIYFDGKTKIGGILVQSVCLNSTVHCSIGIGLNLSNEEPTVCINRILASNGLPTISRERLIASILNHFEKYADAVNAFKVNEVTEAYCNNWIHTDQRVVVREECQTDYSTVPLRRTPQPTGKHADPPSSLRSGHVRSIDEFGYLVVEFQDRSVASLHPDGNSFDAMNGLILPKLTQPTYGHDEKAENVPRLGDAEYPRTKNVRGMVFQVR